MTEKNMSKPTQRPNILMIMVDQMRYPRFGYGDEHGFISPLKNIFGFRGSPNDDNADNDDNAYRHLFPGLWALRDNAAVFSNHRTAAAACVPSRAVMFSGQYGTVTGVTQTDGVFKNGAHPAFPWLDPNRVPTLGHWMQANGYTCHYFGKWHLSGNATDSLAAYGFGDWQQSYPDPHGSVRNNLGYYRDYQFRDLVTSFLRRQGLGIPYSAAHAAHAAHAAQSTAQMSTSRSPAAHQASASKPWFAVASFTNPHDIGVYPMGPRTVYNSAVEGAPYALSVPPQACKGNEALAGTMAIALNRSGFPQACANLPPSWNESLANKPSCQRESVYKVGLALASMAGWIRAMADERLDTNSARLAYAVKTALSTNMLGIPLALTQNPEVACRSFLQYYGYLIHEVDQHIDAVLRALDESGQANNTIVLFTSDHGEYGGAHGMMTQKFHTAYDECIHVPMVVRFPESVRRIPDGLQQIDVLSTHADILPTVLGLAGIRGAELRQTRERLKRTHAEAHMPVGADLSKAIFDRDAVVCDPDTGKEREGVLFMTHDMITAPYDEDADATSDMNDEPHPLSKYDVYLRVIERISAGGERFPKEVKELAPGPICQPCLLHCVVTRDGWKLVRYFAAKSTQKISDQYELYNLNTDPDEQYNLLVFDGAFPTPIDPLTIPANQRHSGLVIAEKARNIMALLKTLERRLLSKTDTVQPRGRQMSTIHPLKPATESIETTH